MSNVALIITIQLKPGIRDEFLPLINDNAQASVRDEPGCQTFNVIVPNDDDNTVILYEVYDDDAAFAAHQETPHYQKFIGLRSNYVVGATRVTGQRY